MPVFLLRDDVHGAQQGALEGVVRAAFPGLMELTSLEDVSKSTVKFEADDPPIVVVALPRGDRDYFDRLVGLSSRQGNGLFLVLMGDEISASDYKRLLRSGGADWVSAKADPSELLDIIARRQSIRESHGSSGSRRPDRRPVTISFVPSAGGVGNSTLVLETAAHIKTAKETRNRRICILDIDFQTSHICDYLDSEARLQIGDLSSAPERLDEHLFESFRTRHSSGIDVFAAPRSKFSAEALDINALDALLSMIAMRYDLVLIDYPVEWFHWTSQIIAACDGAIITGINTIPCLRQVCETLTLVKSSGSVALQAAVAINRCERTLLGSISRRKPVETVLPNERIFFIANRSEAAESVNMGVPMLLGASAGKCRREFTPIAKFCAGLIDTRVISG
jgi:pilus assembly protein CpaE